MHHLLSRAHEPDILPVMKAKTQELLYFLLWTCNILSRPTWRNLNDSFEAWAYRNGFLRELQRLEQQQCLERNTVPPGDRGDRLYRLTEAGRLHALGRRDPVECWNRSWDGRWRLVLFDVPVEHNSARNKLRRYLHARGFGCLQRSVWITPDPVEELRPLLSGAPTDVGTLVMMEARPCTGESDEQIITCAWNFAAINRHYAAYQRVLARCPNGFLRSQAAREKLRLWFAQERQAWQAALEHDPLLPERLLPKDYLGREAWRKRLKVVGAAAEKLRSVAVPRQ